MDQVWFSVTIWCSWGGCTERPGEVFSTSSGCYRQDLNACPLDQKASAIAVAPFMRVSWLLPSGDNQNGWGVGRRPAKHRWQQRCRLLLALTHQAIHIFPQLKSTIRLKCRILLAGMDQLYVQGWTLQWVDQKISWTYRTLDAINPDLTVTGQSGRGPFINASTGTSKLITVDQLYAVYTLGWDRWTD